ncbi:glycyl-tRNA synthetase [Methanocella paludicola SANAE]|uniref:glycine--tRNA ligase n=1 Tax=Methanocella paludicola (strain DSM 17711 / JCM 13418 / NBRC 101707 / SANAE) TaxID=304371 RepID=D1YUU8_METPS|nr:glycine--tRNA ligase [Methanocella paludicola]BAI60220.1 glycyl-tRNA synthetase [Methanocella paludicola SANAE]
MDTYDKVFELAKNRGFIWPSFEIYGGASGFYDYGPMGATLKRKIEDAWRRLYCVGEGFYEIEAPTIGVEAIFEASGHVGGFADPMTTCQKCKESFRADHIIKGVMEIPDGLKKEQLTEIIKNKNIECPECGGPLGEVYDFNLMFNTWIGPGQKKKGYLRPETAQGMFVDFPRLLRFYREKLPFGVTQIGKSYRNEISPRQGVIRLREFTQAEAEVFVNPKDKNSHPNFAAVRDMVLSLYDEDCQLNNKPPVPMTVGDAVAKGTIANEYLAYYVALTNVFLATVGIDPKRLRFRQHMRTERAHYATDCWDAEVLLERFGWVEIVGIADRTNYDLTAHQKRSEVDMSVFVPFEKPMKVTRTIVTPDMKVIGPKYKGKAGKIMAALKAMKQEELSKPEVVLNIDGEDIVIPSSLFEHKTVEEDVSGENVLAHVVEPSYGVDRTLYSALEHAYGEEIVKGEERIVLRLARSVAPITAAVLPLLSKEPLAGKARAIALDLKEKGFFIEYDESGTIGKRYRRNDEVGTPFSITIDFDTMEDDTVTIRDRDTMSQVRVPVKDLSSVLGELLASDRPLTDFGKKVAAE